MRRRLLIAGSILAACAFAGGAYAAASSDTSPRQAFLNDVAKRLHVSPQQLKSALEGAFQDRLNAAVKAGELTQAQANAIEKRLREGGPPALPFFHRGLVPPLPFFHRGLVPRGPGLVPFRPFFAVGPFAGAAQYIGVAPEQLFKQLASGKSLAQIARAHGKSVSGLENAMVAAERSRLDRARRNGLLTRRQEQRLLSGLRERISALVNQAGFRPPLRPLRAPRFGPPNAPRFGPKMIPPLGALPGGPPPLS